MSRTKSRDTLQTCLSLDRVVVTTSKAHCKSGGLKLSHVVEQGLSAFNDAQSAPSNAEGLTKPAKRKPIPIPD